MRELNIPDWAKFLRDNTEGIFIIGLIVAASISDRTKKEPND